MQAAPRPVVDVGDIINQASNAFQANKTGVLTRAILQQKADQARQAQARQDAQLQLEQQRFGLAQRQQQTQEQLHAAQLMSQGYEDVTGQPQTTTPDGKPQASVSVGERQYRLNPANTPDAKKKAGRLEKLQAYNDALDPKDPKRLQAQDIDLLANDDNLFNTFTTHRLGLTPDPVATHLAERKIDQRYPLREPSEDPKSKRADAYITRRIQRLTAPGPKDAAGQAPPGLDFDSAQTQAVTEAGKLYGHEAIASYGGAMPPPDAAPTAHDSTLANTVFARIANKQATIEQALASPSLSDGVKALVRHHFKVH